ncbi:hypothetical protein O9993_01550 [Vibrio lentus]|nr:hypothetical protein [Vibrio lentus]
MLSGVHASGPHAYLGRYHQQVSVLREGRDKELFGWAMPGKNSSLLLVHSLVTCLKVSCSTLTTTTNSK